MRKIKSADPPAGARLIVLLSHVGAIEYWRDGEWYVGRLVGIRGVFSQGKTLQELEDNLVKVYKDIYRCLTRAKGR